MSVKLKINKCIGSIIYPKHTETNDKQWMTEEGWNGVEVLSDSKISVQVNVERDWLGLVEMETSFVIFIEDN